MLNKEPMTALTKNTAFTFNTQAFSSHVQHNRHQSQVPMRSEKVYLMTQMINDKIEQLASEKIFIKQGYQAIDKKNDAVKAEINKKYQVLKEEKDRTQKELEDRE